MLDNESSDRFWRFQGGVLLEATERSDRENLATQVDSLGFEARTIKHDRLSRLTFGLSPDIEFFTADIPVCEQDVAGRPTGIRVVGSRSVGVNATLHAFQAACAELGWTPLPNADAALKEVFLRDPKVSKLRLVGVIVLLAFVVLYWRYGCG
jgi:hypothetical protein